MKNAIRLIFTATFLVSLITITRPEPAMADAVLVISEIMYNPNSTEDNWEWIEIANTGDTAADLTGYVLDDNNSYEHSAANIAGGTVEAGGSAVLYNVDDINQANFVAAWGAGINLIPVTGWSNMALNNDGDTIGLWTDFASYNGDNENHTNAILSITYDDGSGWPNANNSSSIYLTDLSLDASDGSNWGLSTVGGSTPVGIGRSSVAAGTNSGSDIGSPGPGTNGPAILINEVDADQVSTDSAEFIELYDGGAGNSALDGLVLVFFNGNGDVSYAAFDLDEQSTDGDGYYVLCANAANTENCDLDVSPDTNLIQNGPDAVALYRADGADFPNGTAVTTTDLIEAIVYDIGDGDDAGLLVLLNSDQPQVDESGGGSSTAHSNQRCPNGTGGERNTDTYEQWNPTPGTENTCQVGSNCGDLATYIHTIQASDPSSEVGNSHTLEGLVVGDFQGTGNLSGFFLQEETSDFDGDPTTSEGIFIYEGSSSSLDVSEGDVVRLTGTVQEFNTLTEMSGISGLQICSSGNTLDAAIVSLPENTDGDLENYEGMLIEISNNLTVVQNYFLGRYGQMTLSGSGRLYQPTNQYAPGSPQAIALASLNARSLLFLDDGTTTENPDPVPYIGSPTPAVIRAGDIANNLVGVLDYGLINSTGGRDYRLHPTQNPSFTQMNSRTAAPASVGDAVSVASFNVLNYFVTLDDSGLICGPSSGMECRGADSSSEFTRQRDKIVEAICTINADIFGLIELENPNPSNDPESGDGISNYVLKDLVAGLNDGGSLCPEKTYTFIDGAATGTDAIQVGIIYKDSVTPVSGLVVLDDAGFTDPNNSGTQKNRPAQAIAFEDGGGEHFSVVVNHLVSKGSTCGVGDDDDATGQGNCNGTREAAAIYLDNWITSDPTGSGDADYLVIGDLNAYAQEDPIIAFTDNGFLNLIEAVAGTTAYTNIFDGQSGYLDHAIANRPFLAQVSGLAIWHTNADEPSVIDYDEDENPAGYYNLDPYRSSDHDPVVIGLDLQAAMGGTINNLQENVTYALPNNICGSILFTTQGTVDYVEVTYRQSYPSVNLDGLPRAYEVRAYDSGDSEVTSGFEAQFTMCYADIDLTLAGIDLEDEDSLDAYRYQGTQTWEMYSIVDTANNTVTAENVTGLGYWGLGTGADQPTAVRLQRFEGTNVFPIWRVLALGLMILGGGVLLVMKRRRV